MSVSQSAQALAFWESVHKPLPVSQFNPCKVCGRTSIFPVCGTCQLIAELRRKIQFEKLKRC